MLRKRARGEEMVRIQIKDFSNKDLVVNALKALDSVAIVDFVKDSHDSFLVTSKENQSSRKDIFNVCVQKNWILTEMTPIETKLEDIFRELTTN
jgi:ABC-2 type transport system ATP-binding protein